MGIINNNRRSSSREVTSASDDCSDEAGKDKTIVFLVMSFHYLHRVFQKFLYTLNHVFIEYVIASIL